MEHRLTEKQQKKYCYSIGPYYDPVLSISPGDKVIVDTVDAFEGKIIDSTMKASDVVQLPFVNPLNGPIFVNGAEIGDTLIVHVESIKPRGPQPRGTTCLQKYFGALSPFSRSLSEPFPEIVKKLNITEDGVCWNQNLVLPYEPFIGTIGTSPRIYSIDSLTPDSHGGNMDLPDIAPGATLYLPVRVDGALLFLGDCHACQGDGELCGVAVEFPSETIVRIDLIKQQLIQWPYLETNDFIMGIGSGRPLEDAVKIAYDVLIQLMIDRYSYDKWDAYLLVSQAGRIRVGNVVDPKYTVGASILKRYLSF
ncbi:MAG: acetamidase/formamidase family protein [Atribacterota bacterium]|jgi:amidase|nr:acetamidase/formamidase family protein [Atribacterota bacterium]